jgi:5-oxopent-3-ene-1,2,5-tricarboxylate decarboxylase/2-hydroxyhepta-2,4-diene-1,7-dioate isomerase
MNEVLIRLRGVRQPVLGGAGASGTRVRLGGRELDAAGLELDPPTDGTLYGVLFNFPGTLEALGDAVHASPYVQPPKAPVLYIKPANTWIGAGMSIPLPSGVDAVQVGATLGIVIGRAATRVSMGEALEHVAGFTLVNDITIPHESFHRPPLRHNCRDGFCPIGPWVVDRKDVPDPVALEIRAFVNGELRQTSRMADLLRPVPQLLADVTEFMTLFEGDILTVGVAVRPPLARAGDIVAVEADGLGRLQNPVVAEDAAIAACGGRES